MKIQEYNKVYPGFCSFSTSSNVYFYNPFMSHSSHAPKIRFRPANSITKENRNYAAYRKHAAVSPPPRPPRREPNCSAAAAVKEFAFDFASLGQTRCCGRYRVQAPLHSNTGGLRLHFQCGDNPKRAVGCSLCTPSSNLARAHTHTQWPSKTRHWGRAVKWR